MILLNNGEYINIGWNKSKMILKNIINIINLRKKLVNLIYN